MNTGCICAICYENVVPANDILQTIGGCGHVFHEHCLQRWISICPNARTPTCPLCKKSCLAEDVRRLYFQSLSDDSVQVRDTGTSQVEVNTTKRDRLLAAKMEGKLETMKTACSALKDRIVIFERTEKLHRGQMQALKEEAINLLREKGELQQSLNRTREDLRKSLERKTELLEKNMSMSKEMAVMQLTTDLNLSEEDMKEVASLSRASVSNASKDEIIETMAKSLFVRNKAFKELMRKCQELGMGESRAEQKSERLTGQLKRMKVRMRELARAEEEKENAHMRSVTNAYHRDKSGSSVWPLSTSAVNIASGTPELRKSRVAVEESFCSQLEPRLAFSADGGTTAAEVNLPLESENNSSGRGGPHATGEEVVRFSENLDAAAAAQNAYPRFMDCNHPLPNSSLAGTSSSGVDMSAAARSLMQQRGSPDFRSPQTPTAKPKITIGLDGGMEAVEMFNRRMEMLRRAQVMEDGETFSDNRGMLVHKTPTIDDTRDVETLDRELELVGQRIRMRYRGVPTTGDMEDLEALARKVELLRRGGPVVGDVENLETLGHQVELLSGRQATMLPPIRQELGLGRGAQPFARSQSETPESSHQDASFAPTPSPRGPPRNDSTFIVSGADGRGGRITVLKPPRGASTSGGSNVFGLTRTKRLDDAFTRSKRPKTSSSQAAGTRNAAALKIEHFFGRG